MSDPTSTLPPSEAEAAAEHARLQAEIHGHDRAYYEADAPTISDADYDALRRRLVALEAAFPALQPPLDARVGSAPSEKFAKVLQSFRAFLVKNGLIDASSGARLRRFLWYAYFFPTLAARCRTTDRLLFFVFFFTCERYSVFDAAGARTARTTSATSS